MAEFKEFINPKSMLTPGLAGGITMMIANTLWVQFALPQKWTALLVSFLFGAIVFSVKTMPIWQRPIFYLLNSLIIFSMGVGVNTVGNTVASVESSRETAVYLDSNPGNFFDSWLSPAWAEPDDRAERLDQEIEMLERHIRALREERETAKMEEAERHSSPDRHRMPKFTRRLPAEAEWEAEPRPEPTPRPEPPPKPRTAEPKPPPEPERTERQFFQGWFR